MKKLFLIICVVAFLQGCATTRNVVVMPTLEICPEPTTPTFNMDYGPGHIGSLDPLDALMEDVTLAKDYTIRLKNSNNCYKSNVTRLQTAIEQGRK